MDKNIKQRILRDKNIKKFSAYGFLRNLAFFKPFLLIYLMSKGLDLFQIGLLYSVREIIVYIFEVPSGIIADYFGRKKEMYLCFIFYIISFILFALSSDFWFFVFAMAFFGLGEAFRTGTHKAMILTYIEKNDLIEYKTFIYGRTRSFSLIGTALSSLIAILIALFTSNFRFMFFFSIVPYILNLLLIYTYPKYLDKGVAKEKNIKIFIKNDFFSTFKKENLRRIILNQSIFQAVLKSLKDIIQPIIAGFIITSGALNLNNVELSNRAKVVLGLFYFFVSIFSSIASRNSYKLKKYLSTDKFINYSFAFLGVLVISISFLSEHILLIIVVFIFLNVLADARKPIYIELLDEHMNKKLRASVMSLESQITAIFIAIFAPFFGYIADKTSIYIALFATGFALVLIYTLFTTLPFLYKKWYHIEK